MIILKSADKNNALLQHYRKLADSYADEIIFEHYVKGLSEQAKEELLAIIQGKLLPQLYMDVIAKQILNPDIYPDRLKLLIQGVVKDTSIEIDGSFSNEGIIESIDSKKIVFDIPARLSDGKLAIVEIQVVAQDFLPERMEIYAANALSKQYRVAKGEKKSNYSYHDVKGVIVIVLMAKSPMIFQDYESKHYIHRTMNDKTDSGMELNVRQRIVYVQLDKCLEQLKNGEDGENNAKLQIFLSAIADINNEIVKKEIIRDEDLRDILFDLSDLAKDKEVQISMLETKFAEADWNAALSESEKRGLREGEKRGYLKGEEIGIRKGEEIGIRKGEEIGIRKGEEIGIRKGEEIGIRKGQELANQRLADERISAIRKLIQIGSTKEFILDLDYSEQEYEKAKRDLD